MDRQDDSPEKEGLIERILKLADEIYRSLQISVPQEWMTSDLTLAQLRVLLVLHTEEQQRMSGIADAIGIKLSTATGVVDNLVKKGLVLRESDQEDRRLVICRLSPLGEEQIKKLWTLSGYQIARLLRGLTIEELRQAAAFVRLLLTKAPRAGIPGA